MGESAADVEHGGSEHSHSERGGSEHGRSEHSGIECVDLDRITAMCATLRQSTTEGLLDDVFGGVADSESLISSISKYCTFDHGAILVFPKQFSDAMDVMPSLGAVPGSLIPSVIVKSRLSERYGIAPELLDVRLTHAALTGLADYPRMIEIFMARRTEALTTDVVARERALELERHFALRLLHPDPVVVQGLRWMLREQAGFSWDGGGFNPADDPEAGGTSVLYFLKTSHDAVGRSRRHRLEIKFQGDYSAITRLHTGD